MYVQIKGLNFRYKNSKEETIRDFNVNMVEGETLSILGESGSGKSTILRLVAGLEVPTSGTIVIDNRIMVDDQTFVPPENRGLGMVFQDYALFPHMTVEANVKFGLRKMSKREKDRRLKEVLELVNLAGYASRFPYELSGGQQQRIALARALAPAPSLLLLDEPFSNLDRDLHYKIREELKIILKQTGTTSIFVTHDSDDAIFIADRVVWLKRGQIFKIGDPRVILADTSVASTPPLHDTP